MFSQQDMFFRLWHGTVGAGDDKNRSVHLGGTGDHVLDVVGVSGTVDMCVVTVLGLVLDGGGVDGDTTRAFFRGGVDFVVFLGGAVAHGGKSHGECGGEGGLAVVDVADCADVDVGFLALEFAAGGSDGEAVTSGGGRGGGSEVEDGRGVEERGGEVGFGFGFGEGNGGARRGRGRRGGIGVGVGEFGGS